MSDLEVTANVPSPTGKREHIIPCGPHHLSAREDAGEEPAIVLLHGFPDNQHLSDRLVPPPCPTTGLLGPTGRSGLGLGFPDRLLRAAASVDGVAATLARAALAPRPRPRYRPGRRNRLDDPAADRAPHAVLGSGQDADHPRGKLRPPAAPGPDGAVMQQPRRSTHRQGRRRQGATPVNRCGDRTTTPSTCVRPRGLMLPGLCLTAGPPSAGRWPIGRPNTACPPSPRPGP
jgi:hypothetical protein